MKKIFFAVSILFFTVRLSALDFITSDEVQPGMKGYGLTVIKGWEPERFEVEIIDVVKNYQPGGDMILARLSGAGLENSGIIAGMSGSPVYINNRLLGAVAFTWSYTKEPICGITPIGLMLQTGNNARPAAAAVDEGRIQKIATPISVNGFAPEAREFIKKNIDVSNGLLLTGGSSGSNPLKNPGGLKAGDSVAINLVDGDYNAQGVGTVTYVSNDSVYVFGHPMDQAGAVALPVSRSYVYSVIPSSYLSFKIGSSSQPLGAAVFDGQNAVYCKLGAAPAMIPVHVRVSGIATGKDYHFRVADSKFYFPMLSSGAVASSFLNHTGYLDDKRIMMDLRMELDYNGRKLTVTNSFVYAFNPSFYNINNMENDLNNYFSVFYDETFGKTALQSVDIGIKIEPGLKFYTMESISLDRTTCYPGETVYCKVVLHRYQSGYKTVVLPVRIPETVKNGPYWIYAGSQPSVYGEMIRFFPKYFVPSNIDDLIKLANWQEDPLTLVAGILYADQGLIVRDHKLEKFPDNYAQFFFRPAEKNAALFFPGFAEGTEKQDATIFGIQRTGITIQGRQPDSVE